MRGARQSPGGLKRCGGILLVVSGLLIGFAGCVGAGPAVVIVPAAPGEEEPVRLAEPIKAKVFVPLLDGTTVISKNRVKLPAGGWYHWFEPPEDE